MEIYPDFQTWYQDKGFWVQPDNLPTSDNVKTRWQLSSLNSFLKGLCVNDQKNDIHDFLMAHGGWEKLGKRMGPNFAPWLKIYRDVYSDVDTMGATRTAGQQSDLLNEMSIAINIERMRSSVGGEAATNTLRLLGKNLGWVDSQLARLPKVADGVDPETFYRQGWGRIRLTALPRAPYKHPLKIKPQKRSSIKRASSCLSISCPWLSSKTSSMRRPMAWP